MKTIDKFLRKLVRNNYFLIHTIAIVPIFIIIILCLIGIENYILKICSMFVLFTQIPACFLLILYPDNV